MTAVRSSGPCRLVACPVSKQVVLGGFRNGGCKQQQPAVKACEASWRQGCGCGLVCSSQRSGLWRASLLTAPSNRFTALQLQGMEIPKNVRTPDISGVLEAVVGKLEKDRAALQVRSR